MVYSTSSQRPPFAALPVLRCSHLSISTVVFRLSNGIGKLWNGYGAIGLYQFNDFPRTFSRTFPRTFSIQC